jgi:hypothetical protein
MSRFGERLTDHQTPPSGFALLRACLKINNSLAMRTKH